MEVYKQDTTSKQTTAWTYNANPHKAFLLLWQNLQPSHQGGPVSIHAALQTVLLLQLRGRHLLNMIPQLELLAREDVDASATVCPPATKAIPTEPLLAYIELSLC